MCSPNQTSRKKVFSDPMWLQETILSRKENISVIAEKYLWTMQCPSNPVLIRLQIIESVCFYKIHVTGSNYDLYFLDREALQILFGPQLYNKSIYSIILL